MVAFTRCSWCPWQSEHLFYDDETIPPLPIAVSSFPAFYTIYSSRIIGRRRHHTRRRGGRQRALRRQKKTGIENHRHRSGRYANHRPSDQVLPWQRTTIRNWCRRSPRTRSMKFTAGYPPMVSAAAVPATWQHRLSETDLGIISACSTSMHCLPIIS